MRKINIGKGAILASQISLGCMRMADLTVRQAQDAIHAAMESGVDFFDHADIYGNGESEEIFARRWVKNPPSAAKYSSSPNAASGRTRKPMIFQKNISLRQRTVS